MNETDVTPVLLGNPDKIRIYLEIEGVLDGYEVIDPHSYPGFEEMVASLVERRKGKMTEEEAREVLINDVNYFGVMLVIWAWLMVWFQELSTLLRQLFVQPFKS